MAYLYTAIRSLGTYTAHRGYVTYSTSETSTAVIITVSDLGEYFSTTASSGSSPASSSGSTTVSATLGSYFTRTGTKSSIGSVTAPKYVSFGISSASQTINKGTSATTVRLTISWTWNGTTTTNYVDIRIPAISTCTITYNANGGTGSMANTTYTYQQSNPVHLRTNSFTRTGYNFLGWSLNSSASTASYSDGQSWSTGNSGNYTLYAIWKKKTYTVSYDGNKPTGVTSDVSNLPSNQTKTYGVSLSLSSKTPTLSGYNFTEWNTAQDGSGTSYQPSQTYSSNYSLSLYAQWTPKHSIPTISNKICKRQAYNSQTQTYEDLDTGTYLYLSFNYAFDTGGSEKTYSIACEGKTTLTGSLNTSPFVLTPNDLTSAQLIDWTFSTDNNYTITITISETFNGKTYSTSTTTFLSKAFFILDFGSEGYGIGIGQAADSSATSSAPRLDIGIPTYANSYVTLGNWSAGSGIYGTDSNGNHVPMIYVSSSDNVVVGNASSSNNANQVNIYGYKVNLYANPTDLSSARTQFNTNGTVTLAAAPTANMHAATKQYVDDSIPSFGDLIDVGRSSLTNGYTPTSDGFLIISGTAASGQTPYVYVYGNFNGTVLNVFAQNAAAGGRVGACIPLKSGITYTWLYNSATSYWNEGKLPSCRFMPIE